MTVKELIKDLQKIKDKNSNVFYVYKDMSTGCDTCGCGAMQVEGDIYGVEDLEGKVWLR